ncbi:site-specific recombinase, phage integrase family [Oesophagostomum dentatum]|uniref:Site-specific recombinase, phage integrase family n=1 Tax=Oesophagostomum dentatum TaxID=61180 RepID=A0A0B1TMU6_OESDE|nr:site-specific recombinase, phage integrase family [Oesophagostomum dentatum]
MRRPFLEFTVPFAEAVSHLGKYRNLLTAHLINRGQTKSISLAIAALNFLYGHLTDGEAELQKLLVDSAKRDMLPVTHRKKATQEDVDAVVQWALKEDTATAITESCIILLLFLAFLIRKSHLEDKGGGTWWLKIPKSKIDQRGKGSIVAFNVKGVESVLWNKFIEITKQRSKNQLMFANPTDRKPKTNKLRKRINAVLKNAGLSHKRLTSHSFRGGAATTALRRGVSQEDIKPVGRWKSTSAMLSYIEPTAI